MPDHEKETVAQILREYRQQTGDSYQAIARATGLPKSTVAWLTTTEYASIQHGTLEALSSGLGVPLRRLTQAARVSAGIERDHIGYSRGDKLAPLLARLSEDDYQRVRTIVAALGKEGDG